MEKRKKIGFLFVPLLFLVVTWLWILIDFNGYLHLMANYVSLDGEISNPFLVISKIHVVVLFITFFGFVFSRTKRINVFNKTIYFISGLIILAHLLLNRYYFIKEDGPFETGATLIAFLASFVFLFLFLNEWAGYRKIVLGLLFLSFFSYGMEEISWGQRIFGWGTPEFFVDCNYQKETNLHNIFNPYLKEFYIGFNVVLGGTILFFKYRLKHMVSGSNWYRFIIFLAPFSELVYYGYIFLFLGWYCYHFGWGKGGELTEEIFSIFGFAYAINLLPGRKMKNGFSVKGRLEY